MEQEYVSHLVAWRSLEEEVVFTINEAVGARAIKIHLIESRIKDLESFVGKAADKNYKDPIEDMVDIVGVRVVVLFKSNLEDIDNIIYNEFDVISKNDKADDANSALGYRSIHYVCEINQSNSGPRYDKILGLKFEIQVRTICMHAWAAVSHYLDYKGDWDVPKDLKGSLQALSGVFHVADSQFEQFFSAREKYHLSISDKEFSQSEEGINLESLSSYLEKKFPKRDSVDKVKISPFVHELRELDVRSFKALDDMINAGAKDLMEVEKKGGNRYSSLGAARVSLGLVSQEYRNMKYDGITRQKMRDTFSTPQDD